MEEASIDAFASVSEMLEALNKRGVSAVELLNLHLHRIERYNPALGAIVTFDVEHARQAANASDGARARGEHGVLLGLPVTIKDTIDVKGLPGAAGVERYKDRRPAHDAPLVALVRAAGAVIIGKTNVPPYAGDWQAANPVFGRPHNPWDSSRTPGGSTGVEQQRSRLAWCRLNLAATFAFRRILRGLRAQAERDSGDAQRPLSWHIAAKRRNGLKRAWPTSTRRERL
jgi:amidase